ncbi:unnamed protein product [Ilex paraguariensis]|uniref:DUF868 domain-containing protein n=1 Tax=Ilex paraguariensis TaxID=185542 RepID=A0ABC8RJB0_9AQUA
MARTMFNLPVEAVLSSSESKPRLEWKPTEEATTNKPAQNFVTCVHKVKIEDLIRNVTTTWSRNLINHSLCFMVENPSDDDHYTCKIDIKTWQFWGKKGLKSFRVDEKRVDVFWDLRCAKFSTSPEPSSDYYVAVVSDEEVVLLLGDQKNEAFKRTKSRPSLVDATLVHKKENVFAKKCFFARTMLGQGKKAHDIVIETSLSGDCEPEMWIGIDGTVSIRVMNLHWRFRGNETLLVDDVQVQILWDVHDWLYNIPNSGPGVFIFKQGEVECEPNTYLDSKTLKGEGCESHWRHPTDKDFCHFLYAWKLE